MLITVIAIRAAMHLVRNRGTLLKTMPMSGTFSLGKLKS